MAAILAGTLHGHAGDFEAARVAFHLALGLSSPRRKRHAMTVLSALPEHEANQLIGELPVQEQDPWMEWELESGLYKLAQKDGLAKGLAEGRAEAHTEIRAALVRLIFDLLDQRGVELDEHSAARIHGCEDLETLQRWIRNSATASRGGELF